jgi:hypothetical protein
MLKKRIIVSLLLMIVLGLLAVPPARAQILYQNDFEDPSSEIPHTAWEEWRPVGGSDTARAVNGRIEWYDTSVDNSNWLALGLALPMDFVMEFDFFYDQRTNGRFSVWPLAPATLEGATIFSHHNYFLRQNTHYFNGSDTIPSEGPCDLTLSEGQTPHRLRFEVTGDHVIFLFKDQGEGPWIKVDERDFPPFGDQTRNIQLGFNKDFGGPEGGVHYIDNFQISVLGGYEVTIERFIDVNSFTAESSVPVRLELGVSGAVAQAVVKEQIPDRWSASDISHGGVLVDGMITWNLVDVNEDVLLTYKAVAPGLVSDVTATFSGELNGARIDGETTLGLLLPYLFRESVDYNFSGSPIDGKNYPTGTEKGVRYAEGLDGIPSSTMYFYPAFDVNEFVFPAEEDFFYSGTGVIRGSEGVTTEYRDPDEIVITPAASDTGIAINGLAAGDWFRYTFDFGEVDHDQVLFANYWVNTWQIAEDGWIDVYLDNQRIAETAAPPTLANELNPLTAGPVLASGGVHDLVIAFPEGSDTPVNLGRIEVILSDGIGSVTRTLPDGNSVTPGTALEVSLTAQVLLGSVAIEIQETAPEGVTVSDISDGGVLDGNVIRWVFDTMVSGEGSEKVVTYKVTPAADVETISFDGIAGVGKVLADTIGGDNTYPKPVAQ